MTTHSEPQKAHPFKSFYSDSEAKEHVPKLSNATNTRLFTHDICFDFTIQYLRKTLIGTRSNTASSNNKRKDFDKGFSARPEDKVDKNRWDPDAHDGRSALRQ